MRNRSSSALDISFDVVWDTVQLAFPGLLRQLPALRQAGQYENLVANEIGEATRENHGGIAIESIKRPTARAMRRAGSRQARAAPSRRPPR
jgi:hypothetical protein